MYRANIYISLADTTFKERHSNHKGDFKHQKYRNCTELAKYVWELKEENITLIIKWEILIKVYGNPKQNMSILCLTEKLWIINFIHDNNYLNKKSELINKCRHINKFLLKDVRDEFDSSSTLYEYKVFSKFFVKNCLI